MTYLRLFCLALLYSFIGRGVAQRIEVENLLESNSIQIGEQTYLYIRVLSPISPSEIVFPTIEELQLPQSIEVLEATPVDTIRKEGELYYLQRSYLITSFDTADIVIPRQVVIINSDSVYAKNNLSLHVTTPHIDKSQNPRPFHSPLVGPFSWTANWIFLAVLLYLLLGSFVFLLGWLVTHRRLFRKITIIPPPLPHQKALHSLEKLNYDIKKTDHNIKDFFMQLSDILREYLTQRLKIQAKEMTTQEILVELTQRKELQHKAFVKSILLLSDRVKFARYITSIEEQNKALQQAVAYIHNTSPSDVTTSVKKTIIIPLTEKRQKKIRNIVKLTAILTLILAFAIYIYLYYFLWCNFF